MSKKIIVTDTHLGMKHGSDDYHNITLNLFKEICEIAESFNIKEFIHAGDFFDVRRSVSLKTIPVAYNIMDMLRETFSDIYLIVGNHDTYYKNSLQPTSLQLFDNMDGVSIVDTPIVIDNNIHLQPWLLDDFKSISSCDYLIGHFEMSGIVINRVGTESKSGISISEFKNYKKVLSGHYHTKSITGNIEYLGSPYHMTFNDDGARGYYIFNDGELDFYEFTNAPKFIIFEHDGINTDQIKGNNIKVVFTKDIGTTKINKVTNDIVKFEPNQLFIEFNFDESFTEKGNDFKVDEIIDLRSLEKKYLDNSDIPKYIDRNKIEKEMDILWNTLKEK